MRLALYDGFALRPMMRAEIHDIGCAELALAAHRWGCVADDGERFAHAKINQHGRCERCGTRPTPKEAP